MIENALDVEGKKEVEAKMMNAKTVKDRMGIVTSHICNAKGIPYEEANAKVLFGVLVKTLNKASVTEIRKPAATTAVQEKIHPIFYRG